MTRILVADDEVRIGEALRRLLELEGFSVVLAQDGVAALAEIEKGGIDLVLLDLDMPRKDGLSTLRELRALGSTLPVIVVSGQGTIQRAVESTKLGAQDFVEKPIDDERLLHAIKLALDIRQMSDEISILRDETIASESVAESRALKNLFAAADRVAEAGSTVLISGETGSGKEVLAGRIHRSSARASKAFVRLNCAALPDELAESELFGHVKGSFTGAVKDRKGRFQLADRGTLFLDEIGELALPLQAKLLRAIAEGEFEPVGSERTVKADVRIIAATNRDLVSEVARGNFREDLYYRLAVIVLAVPPLRERPEDIAALASNFLSEFARKFGRRELRLVEDGFEALLEYSWPGNVRELRNVIERIAVTAPNDAITAEVIEAALPKNRVPAKYTPAAHESGVTTRLADGVASDEKRRIEEAIARNGGNIAATARELGLERSHLYKKMKKLGVKE